MKSVYVSYEFKGTFEQDALIEKMAKKHGGKRTGSGCGFGQRDVDLEFKTLKAAQKFEKEAAKYWNVNISSS